MTPPCRSCHPSSPGRTGRGGRSGGLSTPSIPNWLPTRDFSPRTLQGCNVDISVCSCHTAHNPSPWRPCCPTVQLFQKDVLRHAAHSISRLFKQNQTARCGQQWFAESERCRQQGGLLLHCLLNAFARALNGSLCCLAPCKEKLAGTGWHVTARVRKSSSSSAVEASACRCLAFAQLLMLFITITISHPKHANAENLAQRLLPYAVGWHLHESGALVRTHRSIPLIPPMCELQLMPAMR